MILILVPSLLRKSGSDVKWMPIPLLPSDFYFRKTNSFLLYEPTGKVINWLKVDFVEEVKVCLVK